MKTACVGTRFITLKQARDIAQVGRYLARTDIILSGNAEGADHAFAMGANEVNTMRVKLYLPWPGFRAEHVSMGNRVIPSPPPEHLEYAEAVWKQYRGSKYGYGDWSTLSDSTRNLMGRNWSIVADSDRVVAVPSFNKLGVKGGTAFALNVADFLGKPVQLVDLRNPEDPSWDRCRNCGCGRTFFDCGGMYHLMKPYYEEEAQSC